MGGTCRTRATSALVALGLLAAGCGPPAVDFTGPATLEPAAEPTKESGPAFEGQTFSVGQTFWHSGFRVELGEGRVYAEQDEATGEIDYLVSIDARFENLGGRQVAINAPITLVAGGDSIPTDRRSDLPGVPAGLASDGALIFEIEPDFDTAGAQLIVGRADEIKAQIPLGPQGGQLDTLAPSQPAVSGELSMELIDLRFTGAELRADRPENYSQLADGKLALTLYFDATSRRGGNWSINPQDFALILPGGSAVAADGAELGSLPGNPSGLDTTGLWVRFLIDDPPNGGYTLRFTPGSWFVGDDEVTEATIGFSLEDRIRGSSRE